MGHLLLHYWYDVSGANNEGGPVYGSWSGIAGGLQVLEWLALGLLLLRHHNCEVHRCWRLRWRATAAGHQVCKRHHPGGPLTHEAVLSAHAEAIGESP